MRWKNTIDRYGVLSIGLHWLMFLLLVGVYACIELREMYPRGSDPREALKAWHFMLGLTVFGLVWVRLLVRFTQISPRINDSAGWRKILATSVHLALYAFMIGMPIGGWLILSAEGKPIPFFGLELPALMSENKQTAETIEEIHETVGIIGYFLIGFHTLAALIHHYFLRDNVFKRMLPGGQ
jgi:cytochrome b561